MNIFWSAFNDNTSEMELLIDFAKNKLSYKNLLNNVWSHEALTEVKKIKKIPIEDARSRARKWLSKHTFE